MFLIKRKSILKSTFVNLTICQFIKSTFVNLLQNEAAAFLPKITPPTCTGDITFFYYRFVVGFKWSRRILLPMARNYGKKDLKHQFLKCLHYAFFYNCNGTCNSSYELIAVVSGKYNRH